MQDLDKRPFTYFVDIDGICVWHTGNISKQTSVRQLLPGVLEEFKRWDKMGCKIILTTGRKESQRAQTEKQLSELGLFWDYLIMGLGGGCRVLINDAKPDGQVTCFAHCIPRNQGFIKDEYGHIRGDFSTIVWGHDENRVRH